MKNRDLRNFALAGIATAVMLGCGGSGDSGTTAGTGSASITTVGAITGFGSVFVNGVEYETQTAEYEVEDQTAFDDSALKVGMVVKVKGNVNPDGRTGVANQIIYEDELEGLVQELTMVGTDRKSFKVFGVPITVSNTNTFFDTQHDVGFSFNTLSNNDHVEVSGYFNGQALQATYIKKKDALDDDFEIKGVISIYDINTDTYTLDTLFGNTITFTLAGNAMIPQVGQYVEIEGTPTGPTSLVAFKVELEDRHHLNDDEGEIEIYGWLTDNAGNWFLNDIPLDMNGNIKYEPTQLKDTIENNLSPEGMMVKVEGDYRNGVLVVDEIQDKQESLEFKGEVTDITATDAKTGTLTIGFGNATGTVTVILDNNTMYPDDNSVQHFDLRTNVHVGDYVEVKAMQNQAGEVLATLLDVDDSVGEYEIEGPMDSFSDAVSITVMNVTFNVNGSTIYPLGKPTPRNVVDITDLNRDGIADVVEIED